MNTTFYIMIVFFMIAIGLQTITSSAVGQDSKFQNEGKLESDGTIEGKALKKSESASNKKFAKEIKKWGPIGVVVLSTADKFTNKGGLGGRIIGALLMAIAALMVGVSLISQGHPYIGSVIIIFGVVGAGAYLYFRKN